MIVEKSIQIEAPSQAIWPFLTEPDKIMMWFDTFKKFEGCGSFAITFDT